MAQEYLIRTAYIPKSKSNVNSFDGNSNISIIDKIDIMIKRIFYKKIYYEEKSIRFVI